MGDDDPPIDELEGGSSPEVEPTEEVFNAGNAAIPGITRRPPPQ
jgi:hypothetical protein